MNKFSDLFNVLDRDRDGRLTREGLFRVAVEPGWSWQESHLHALLDFLTVGSPLGRAAFVGCLDEVNSDPQDFYGQVLRRGSMGAN